MWLIEKLVELSEQEVEKPLPYGKLHLMFFLATVLVTLLICTAFKNASDRTFRIIIGVIATLMIFLEICKQLMISFYRPEGVIIFEYSWYVFPFQLCSIPLYVLPFLASLSDCRLRDLAASFTMTFALVGGVAVYLVPTSVFSVCPAINVHTMLHHGLQIVSGVYTATYYRRRITARFFIDGVIVFTLVFVMAHLLNTVGYDAFVAMGWMAEGTEFNMFHISPRAEQPIPILSTFLRSINPIWILLGYYVIVILFALIVAHSTRYFFTLSRRKRHVKR